ncbi:Rv2175c family DNA-binding protein [Rhodococcus marinonascens]|uniref:Rv2175c family DNA-binding protein n=1 Tax=Rhodococcus marinonascens TaxID=38311 RepID=UPI0009320DFD|nr:Rv2175c family DNA-binding protein [Rhodococcus marinonascens]
MSAIPYCDDVLDPSISLLQLVDAAKNLGVAVTRVQQLLRDHQLLAVRRDGLLGVPELFFGKNGEIVQWLPGLIAVLHDGGFSDEEMLRWMFRSDDSLPGTPAEALHGDLAREVIRRAQAMGF